MFDYICWMKIDDGAIPFLQSLKETISYKFELGKDLSMIFYFKTMKVIYLFSEFDTTFKQHNLFQNILLIERI